MNNGIFLPIEIMRREYLSKLLLSVELIKRGMPVIIGHKDSVINLALKTKEPGVLFYKAVMHGQKKGIFQELKKKKFIVIAQDEEAGIIYENFKDFYKRRISLKNIDQLDLFFTWGKDEYSFLINKFPKKIVKNYGALRSCFWGELGKKFYQTNNLKIQNKIGNYILLVSNLATYNSYLTREQSIKYRVKHRGFDLEKYKNQYAKEKKIFFQYIDLIKFITEKLNKKVVIRPHPSEDIQKWKQSIKGINNVFVETENELLSWILASDFIIQNNCTSSIEASASNVPVVTYADEIDDLTCLSQGKENIPNKLSLHAFGKEKFTEISKNYNLLWNKFENKERRKVILNRKLKDFGTINAAKNIAQEIIKYVGKPNKKGNQSLIKNRIVYDFLDLFRKIKLSIRNDDKIMMEKLKRETLSYKRIQKDIYKLLDIFQMDQKVKIKKVHQNAFYIYPLISDDKY